MPYFIDCGCAICTPGAAANDNLPVAANDNAPVADPVFVASDDELRCMICFQALACRTAALGLSRYKVLSWVNDIVHGYEGPVLWRSGFPFPRPDTLIDDIFGDDPSCSWPGAFMRRAKTPPRQRPQWRVVPRLRLIDLAFRIADRD